MWRTPASWISTAARRAAHSTSLKSPRLLSRTSLLYHTRPTHACKEGVGIAEGNRDSTGRVCCGSSEACCRNAQARVSSAGGKMPRPLGGAAGCAAAPRTGCPKACRLAQTTKQAVSAVKDLPSKMGLGMVALVVSREARGVQARAAPETLLVIVVVAVSVSRLVGAGGPGPLEVVDVPECLITRSSRAPRPLGPLRETPPGPHGGGVRAAAGWLVPGSRNQSVPPWPGSCCFCSLPASMMLSSRG